MMTNKRVWVGAFLALSLMAGPTSDAASPVASQHQIMVVVERNGRAINRYEFIMPVQSDTTSFKSGRTLSYAVESAVTRGATTTTTLSTALIFVGLDVELRSDGSDSAVKRFSAHFSYLPDGEAQLQRVFRENERPRLITFTLDRFAALSTTPVVLESSFPDGHKMRATVRLVGTSAPAP